MKKVYFFVVLLLSPILAIVCGPYGPMCGWEPGHMMNYGFGYGGMFMWLIFLIVLGVVIYFIVQTLKSKNVAGQAQDTPWIFSKDAMPKAKSLKKNLTGRKKKWNSAERKTGVKYFFLTIAKDEPRKPSPVLASRRLKISGFRPPQAFAGVPCRNDEGILDLP